MSYRMRVKRVGINRVVPVALVVVILAAAAFAYYLTLAPASNKTSASSTTPQTSSVSTAVTTEPSSSSSLSSVQSSTALSSTGSAAQSSQSGATTQTATCAPTSTSSNSSAGQELVGFLSAYSSMSISFQGTKNGNQDDVNMSYVVAYVSSTTYKVNISYSLNGKGKPGTLWILKNGSILAGERGGKNYTGSTASNFVLDYFSDLETLYTFASQASTITSYFHSAGTSTAEIGANSLTVTEYLVNTTPENFQICNGENAELDTYNVYIGTPSGSSLAIITYADFSGTLTTSSVSNTFDYVYQLTAYTVA